VYADLIEMIIFLPAQLISQSCRWESNSCALEMEQPGGGGSGPSLEIMKGAFSQL